MINLIPHDRKILVEKEYKLRRFAVGLTLLLSVIAIAIILLIPSYLLLYYRVNNSRQLAQLPPTTVNVQDRTDLLAQLNDAELVTNVLKPNPVSLTPTDIISMIVRDKTANNILTSIVYGIDPAPFTITVRGKASSRESLLQFVNALKREPGITNVDLPISNFTKDTSIDFSFVITGEKT